MAQVGGRGTGTHIFLRVHIQVAEGNMNATEKDFVQGLMDETRTLQVDLEPKTGVRFRGGVSTMFL